MVRLITPPEYREKWVAFHLYPAMDEGFEIACYLQMQTIAQIDCQALPKDQPAPAQADLISETVEPGSDLKIKLHGVAYNNEMLTQLVRLAIRLDVDAIIYNFQQQPGHDDIAWIIRIGERGAAAILCGLSSELQQHFLASLPEGDIEVCLWSSGEARQLSAKTL